MAPMGAGLRGVLGPSEADGPVYVAIAGKMRGYVVYTLSPAGGAANARDGGTHRTRPQELKLRELVWLDVDAYRSLCVRCLVYSILVASSACVPVNQSLTQRFRLITSGRIFVRFGGCVYICRSIRWTWLARHDLVGTIAWNNVPSDDPAPDLFVEPRLLHVEEDEGLWLRVIDVPSALQSRGWDVGGVKLTLFVHGDTFVQENDGAWQLTIGEAPTCRATVERVAVEAEHCDLQIGIAALGPLFMVSARSKQEQVSH